MCAWAPGGGPPGPPGCPGSFEAQVLGAQTLEDWVLKANESKGPNSPLLRSPGEIRLGSHGTHPCAGHMLFRLICSFLVELFLDLNF